MNDAGKTQFNVLAFNVSKLLRRGRNSMVCLEFRATRRSSTQPEILELRLPTDGSRQLMSDLALVLDSLSSDYDA